MSSTERTIGALAGTPHRSRGLWLPPERCGWTVVPPPGTEPEQSLDDYLEQEDFRREMREKHDRELREGPG